MAEDVNLSPTDHPADPAVFEQQAVEASKDLLGANAPAQAGETGTKGEVFNSPEQVEQMRTAFKAMMDAAREQGAVKPFKRDIVHQKWEFDPKGIDPENGRPGAMVQRREPVPQPDNLETSHWRTFTEDGGAFTWSMSTLKDNPDSTPMITLETPLDLGFMDIGKMNARKAGLNVEGRRIQDFLLADDGTVHVRSADFSKGYDYQVKGQPSAGLATVEQIAFLRDNLSQSELVTGPDDMNNRVSPRTGIMAAQIAPELAQTQPV